tara:strand:- start:3363 stop:4508 length:1146 start_codon:yes stop_codon:yes gene_type:complete
MLPRFYCLLFVGLFIFFSSQAQTPRIDSLRIVLNSITDPVKSASISSDLSEGFFDTRLYPDSAYFYAEKAFKIAQNNGLIRQKARALANLGMVFSQLDKHEEALVNFQNAKTVFQELDDPLSLSVINSSIANVHYEMKQYEVAIGYFQKAIAMSIKEKDSIGMLIDYMNIGETEYKIGRFDASKTHLEYALNLMQKTNATFAAGHIYYGNTLLALGMVDSASFEGDIALELSEKEGNIKNISEASELLFKANVAQDDYKSAIGHYERFIVYKDSINAAKELNNIEKLKLNFDLSEKEKELAYVSQKTKYLNVIYILAGFGLVLLIFLISRQRKISRMTRDIHEIQTNLVRNKMIERDALLSKNSATSSFTMTKAQDAKIKE